MGLDAGTVSINKLVFIESFEVLQRAAIQCRTLYSSSDVSAAGAVETNPSFSIIACRVSRQK